MFTSHTPIGPGSGAVLRGLLVLTVVLSVLVAGLGQRQVRAQTQTAAEVFYKRSTNGGASFDTFYNLTNDAADNGITRVAAGNGVVHVIWDDIAQPREGSLPPQPRRRHRL